MENQFTSQEFKVSTASTLKGAPAISTQRKMGVVVPDLMLKVVNGIDGIPLFLEKPDHSDNHCHRQIHRVFIKSQDARSFPGTYFIHMKLKNIWKESGRTVFSGSILLCQDRIAATKNVHCLSHEAPVQYYHGVMLATAINVSLPFLTS
jgi:hypothetical protein